MNYMGCLPYFFAARRKKREVKTLQFANLDEAIECYGRGNLVAIDNIKQIIFYTAHGCQPKFVWENQNTKGRITCWFLKQETAFVYKKWLDNRPV